jgi:hypothetical protein
VSSISAQLKSHWRWSEVELSEVTSSEVTGNHVTGTGSHVTGIDRVRMCNRFPHFFLTIVVVQNVTSKGFPWNCGVRACATGSCAISAWKGGHEKNVLRTRIASSKMLTKTKQKYTINHRKAVNEMKNFRQNLKRKGKHVVKCVTKSNIVAQLNKI